MYRRFFFAWAALFTATSVCAQELEVRALNFNTYNTILAFDLRSDRKIAAGLIINGAQPQTSPHADLVLPFAVRNIQYNEATLARIGVYGTWSLASFEYLGSEWPQVVTFEPILEDAPEGATGTTLPASSYPGSLY